VEQPRPETHKTAKMSIAERWTRKTNNNEELIDDGCQTGEPSSIEKSDSQILAADSYDSSDRKYEEKKRQQCISRWASQNTLLKNNNADFENESDIGALQEHRERTRQIYMNRWASRPGDEASLSSALHD
jgi:hypothetical protein